VTLLDDALRAVRDTSTAPPDAPTTQVAASVDLTGARITVDRRLAQHWSTKLWADTTWSGTRSAGISFSGSF
jgi:hypothetical protein